MTYHLQVIIAYVTVWLCVLLQQECNGQVVFRPFFVYKHKQQDKLNNRREHIIQQQLLEAEQAELALQQQQNSYYYDPYYYHYYQHPGQYYPPPYPEINRISRGKKIEKTEEN